MDADHRDGTAKPFFHHVQQEQPARDAATSDRRLLTIATAVMVREEEEVESVTQADAERLPSADLGGARPLVCTGEVVHQRGFRADEAARVAGAVAGRVRAHLTVAFLAMVGRRRVAAVSRVWAGDADAVHETLHGVAPAVTPTRGSAADMAVAVPGGLQLVATGRTHHMPHLALQNRQLASRNANNRTRMADCNRRCGEITWKMGGLSARKQTPHSRASASPTVTFATAVLVLARTSGGA